MPLQSLLRFLGKLTANKILEPGCSETQAVCDRIQCETALKKAKIHPLSLLLSSENYKRGQGYQGKTKWEPDSSILKAIDYAFYKSFMNVEPMGKRFVVAVDVSTSLSSIVPGSSVSTAVAAAAITMMFVRTELDTHVLAYSEGALVSCSLSADMTLAQVTAELVKLPGGSTDCTLPITWATENEKAVDVFIILTNNPLWTENGLRVKMAVILKMLVQYSCYTLPIKAGSLHFNHIFFYLFYLNPLLWYTEVK
uniref:TROVE domain-containing protein n=1 Tax=Mola mola TaxID=94237 RepID=A0A3Q3X377_MOLML